MSITESKDIINIYKLDPLIKTLFEGLEEELPEDIFKHGGPDPVRKDIRVPERELLVSPLAEHVCDVPQGRPQVPPFLLLNTILGVGGGLLHLLVELHLGNDARVP